MANAFKGEGVKGEKMAAPADKRAELVGLV